MDHLLTKRGKDLVGFRARVSLRSRPSIWLRLLGGLFCLVTIFCTSTHLARHHDISLFRGWNRPPHLAVLRPGQYLETVGHHITVEDPAQDVELDNMGMVHDRRDENFYLGGTLTLTSSQSQSLEDPHPSPVIYDPYPAYNSRKWKKTNYGQFQPCLGPRGRDLDRTRFEDMVLVYKGKQVSFPESRFGSHEAMGLDGDVCTDRYSRLGAYGHDDDSEEDVPGFIRPPRVNWNEVDWGELQSLCFDRNAERYKPSSSMNQSYQRPLSFELRERPRESSESEPTATDMKQYHPRSAVLIRSWQNVLWSPDHREYLRAMIMELSLHSGAEYEVFLLVHIKDDELPIFSDAKTVRELRQSIPLEFRNIALFFNNKLLEAWYPKIEEHSPILQHHQPLQIFSQLYPNFDYYWQFEMDGRHTGNIYHFVDKAISFAKQQPRKYLWERNAYFYTPGAHGTWADFIEMTNRSLREMSANTIWGPILGTGIRPMGPERPNTSPEEDDFDWGVGEEADFITFLPIFNPEDTAWTFPDKVWNFKHGLGTPRRAGVITMGRYSRRLLNLIHKAQATRGLGLASEMTGASWSLYHGLKAVHVPHPIYADGQWTPQELARIYNRGTPNNINGGPDSIWNFDHLYDHIMYRLSYMFTTHTAEDMYRRWLGYRTADHEGGKRSTEARFGRHCFPSMFLHTVKNTESRFGPQKAVP